MRNKPKKRRAERPGSQNVPRLVRVEPTIDEWLSAQVGEGKQFKSVPALIHELVRQAWAGHGRDLKAA